MNYSKEEAFSDHQICEGIYYEGFEKHVFDYVLGKISTRDITNAFTTMMGVGDVQDEETLDERSIFMMRQVVDALESYELTLIPAFGIACNIEKEQVLAEKKEYYTVEEVVDITDIIFKKARKELVKYFKPGFNPEYTDAELDSLVDFSFIDDFLDMIKSKLTQFESIYNVEHYLADEDDWEDKENISIDPDSEKEEEMKTENMIREMLLGNKINEEGDDNGEY